MRITAAFVLSIDGKITQGKNSNVSSWASAEDQELFSEMVEAHPVIIMGKKTYETAKKKIKLRKGKLRIVMTKNPEKYNNHKVEGQLEFTNELPKKLVKRLNTSGITKVLLAGGSSIFKLFIEAKLIDGLVITLEPMLFGSGRPILDSVGTNVQLRLKGMEKLNRRGTLLLFYDVRT